MTMLSPYVTVKPAKPNSLSRCYGISSTIIPYVICSTNRGLANKAQLSTTTQWCPKLGHLWFLTWLTHGIIFTCLGLSTKEHDWGHHLVPFWEWSHPDMFGQIGRIPRPHQLGHHKTYPSGVRLHDIRMISPLKSIDSIHGWFLHSINLCSLHSPTICSYPHHFITLNIHSKFQPEKNSVSSRKKKKHQIPNKNSQNQLPFGKLT